MKLQEKFEFLEDLLVHKRETIGIHTGVPFIMLTYDPKMMEIECNYKRETLKEKLISKNLKVLDIPVGRFVFESLKESGQLDQIFKYEKESPDEVREELTKRCKYYLKDWLLSKIEKEQPDIIFLTDIMSLHPYYRVSAIFTSLENDIKIPFVAFYPGEVKENGKLYFLGEYESSEYYRALKI
jgi:hypothetical protein